MSKWRQRPSPQRAHLRARVAWPPCPGRKGLSGNSRLAGWLAGRFGAAAALCPAVLCSLPNTASIQSCFTAPLHRILPNPQRQLTPTVQYLQYSPGPPVPRSSAHFLLLDGGVLRGGEVVDSSPPTRRASCRSSTWLAGHAPLAKPTHPPTAAAAAASPASHRNCQQCATSPGLERAKTPPKHQPPPPRPKAGPGRRTTDDQDTAAGSTHRTRLGGPCGRRSDPATARRPCTARAGGEGEGRAGKGHPLLALTSHFSLSPLSLTRRFRLEGLKG